MPICPLCFVLTDHRFDTQWGPVYRCPDCGLGVTGRTMPEVYTDAYIDRYEGDPIVLQYRTSEAIMFKEQDLPRLRAEQAEGIPTRILEIGVGNGIFGSALIDGERSLEWWVSDISARAIALAVEKGAKEYLHGNWERNDASPEYLTFDAGVMIHTIEHFEDPVRALLLLRGVIRPGGIIRVHTPNFDHASAPNWFHFHKEHLNLFGEKSLAKLFVQCGIVSLRTERLYGDDLVMTGFVHPHIAALPIST